MSDRQGRGPAAARIDEATFEAALQRVVEQIIDSPADDTAGARVVARLQGVPQRAWGPRPLWLAPAAAAALLALVVIGRGGLTPADSPDDSSALSPPGAAGGLAPAAEQPVMAGGLAPIARGSAGRGRARAPMPASTPADEDPSTIPLLDLTGALRLEGLDETVAGSGPAPLPADALTLETLELPALALREDE